MLIDRMLIHIDVHSRRQQHRCLGGHDRCAQQVIGNPVGQLANTVGSGRSDHQSVGTVSQRDMTDLLFLDQVEQFRMHRVTRQCLKRERRHKLDGGPGHNHMHHCPCLDKQPQKFHRLVDRYTAGNAQDDCFSLKFHG